MRQTLFFIPHEIEALGLPMFGAGVALIVWMLISAIWLFALVRKQGWSQETLGMLPLVAIVAAVIYFVLPQIEEGPPDAKIGVPIRGYGMMLLVAVVTGVGLAAYRARQMGIDTEVIYSLAFWLFVAGIAGARLFFILQYNDHFRVHTESGELDWWATARAMFNVTQGGLVVYGSLIGGALAYVFFVYRRSLPPLGLADMIAPSMVIGLAIGRIGCLLNGCCFGGVCYTDLPALTFPAANPPYQNDPSPPYARQLQLGQLHGFTLAETDEGKVVVAGVKPAGPAAVAGLEVGATVLKINKRTLKGLEDAQTEMFTTGPKVILITDKGLFSISIGSLPERSDPVHPAQIYSAINGVALFVFLWFLYPFRRHDGEIFATLLTIYPITRILLEWVRIDESGRFGTAFTISQWVSFALLISAGALWVWVVRQNGETWPTVGSSDTKKAAA